MTCFGCFGIEEIRDDDCETGLKEWRRNRNQNYSAPFAFCIYTYPAASKHPSL